jgi:2-polyprenyl-3-methyl-5-hydroxy-6-metoxy-1,4-benzoquinol methylase/uncharacterized protein YbaR (Trm112 family)
MIWHCPVCRGNLKSNTDHLICVECHEVFPVISGIPDLRYPPAIGEEMQRDLTQARRVAATAGQKSAAELVREFFSSREGTKGWTSHDTEARVAQSLGMPARLRWEVQGWLRPVSDNNAFLDLGCGLGGLLSAAASLGKSGIGIDNGMLVLVVARRLIEINGGHAELACATAEALPLADNSVGGVVMYDVVEHIDNLAKALSEVSRVTSQGGAFACSTPNRFSLAPEPHVHLLGVGWLPRKYQAPYVKKRRGLDYGGTRLLTPWELLRFMKSSTTFATKLILPAIPDAEIAAARGARKILARCYNIAARQRFMRSALLRVGPFFRIIGVKPSLA